MAPIACFHFCCCLCILQTTVLQYEELKVSHEIRMEVVVMVVSLVVFVRVMLITKSTAVCAFIYVLWSYSKFLF